MCATLLLLTVAVAIAIAVTIAIAIGIALLSRPPQPQCGKNNLNLYCIPLHNLFQFIFALADAANEIFSIVFISYLYYYVGLYMHLKQNSPQCCCKLSCNEMKYVRKGIENGGLCVSVSMSLSVFV